MVGLLIAATAVVHGLYRGQAIQWTFTRLLPAAPEGAIELTGFHYTNALPAGPGNTPLTLSPAQQAQGESYLVVELSLASELAGIRRLSEEELRRVKARNTNLNLAEIWICFPVQSWFRLVGPGHPLRSAAAHQEAAGVFLSSRSWNTPPMARKPARLSFAVAFEALPRRAPMGELSFQFKWNRPMPLRQTTRPPNRATNPT